MTFVRVLETKLAEAKSKKDTLKARAASAKTSKQIQASPSCSSLLLVPADVASAIC